MVIVSNSLLEKITKKLWLKINLIYLQMKCIHRYLSNHFLQQILQLTLDLLLNAPGNDAQLTVVLEHFPADVQGQILTVHNAPDEAEVLGQQILTVLHDHHAGGVQLQSPLEVLGVEVEGRLGGY